MKHLILPVRAELAEGAHQSAPVMSLSAMGPEFVAVEGLDLVVRGSVYFDVLLDPERPVIVDQTGFMRRPCTVLG